MLKLELSVIVPCYNEEKNIPELVERLFNTFTKKQIAGEIILINDGSQDRTGEVIATYAQQHENIVSLEHQTNRGLFDAWKTGLNKARGEYVCFIDADLQYQPEDVWRLFRESKLTHADIIQGFRSSVGRLRNSRYILSKGLNALLNVLFNMRLKDNKSGFVLGKKEILEDILRLRYHYYYPQSFITVAAHYKGYRIREIETMFHSRLLGDSFITKNPMKPSLLSMVDLITGVLEFRVFPKKEHELADFLQEHAPSRPLVKMAFWRRLLLQIYFWTFPLHTWMITRNTQKYYQELLQTQWLSPQNIKALQERKLRRLVIHAYNHVSYYREKFDQLGITPKEIRTIEDLLKLPLLSKDDVREHLHFDLLSDNHDKKNIYRITTSGSTGEPFVCYADRQQLDMRWAATLRSTGWTGYQFGDRQARIWHQTIGMSWSQIMKERIDAWLARRIFIPAFEMSDRNITEFVKRLKQFEPVLIDGYAESFNFLAHYIKEHGLPDFPSPKGMISSAQMLPEQSRQIIEQTFHCGVFDKYGSREFSGIAYESDAHDGHLVVAENYIVEILKDGKPARPGELGEVVITDLNNYCMPFLRYRVGDLAVAMDNSLPSPCGRGLPRIGRIEGRSQAVIVGTNGNYVPSSFFGHFFKDYDYLIQQYKVIQEEVGRIRLQLVKAVRFDQATFDKEIIETLHHFLGERMTIQVEFVEKIEMVRTGKQQGVVSHVKLDFQKLTETIRPQ